MNNYIERFLNDFHYFIKTNDESMDIDLYVKLHIILWNYNNFISKNETMQSFENLRERIVENRDNNKYYALMAKLENAIQRNTNPITSYSKLEKEIADIGKQISIYPFEHAVDILFKYKKDKKKLYRLINQFNKSYYLPNFIGAKRLVTYITSAIPAPKVVGLYEYHEWTTDAVQKYIHLYFNLDKYTYYFKMDIKKNLNQKLQKNEETIDIFKFYISHLQAYSFYYLHFTEITFQKQNQNINTNRQYDQLFTLSVISLDNSCKIGRVKSSSCIADNTNTDLLSNLYSKALDNIKSLSDNNLYKIPVFIINEISVNKYIPLIPQNLSAIPSYQLIYFKKPDLIKDLKTNITSKNIKDNPFSFDLFNYIFQIESNIQKKLNEINTKEFTSSIRDKCLNILSKEWNGLKQSWKIPF